MTAVTAQLQLMQEIAREMQTADGSTIGSICSIALQVLREGGNGAICHANGQPHRDHMRNRAPLERHGEA